MSVSGWVVLGILGVVVFYLISAFNKMVSLRNRFKNAFSQIDVQLKRRHDLIPNLVESVKGYMKHERETLEAVIAARNQADKALQTASANPANAEAVKALMGAEGALTGALSRMVALAESYPDLKANQNMGQLMEELRATENKVAFSRQAFNDAVMDYNTVIESFPQSVLANLYDFKPASLWQIENVAEREPVKVAF